MDAEALGRFVQEDGLDRLFENAGDLEGQRQGGVVAAGLQRIDGLARHAQPLGQFGLTPVALGAQHLETVVHVGSLTAAPATTYPWEQWH